MTKEAIVEKTIRTLNMLPVDKVSEVADFADFVLKKYEDYILLKESDLNTMSLAYAEKSFKEGWDLEDEEENNYWNSFV